LNADDDSKIDNDIESDIPITPAVLIGRDVEVAGDMWGEEYKGRTYKGTFTKWQHQPKYGQYVQWTCRFDDCMETFDLEDLKDLQLISDDLFEQLTPTCYTLGGDVQDGRPRKKSRRI